jgi:hypothetical protein
MDFFTSYVKTRKSYGLILFLRRYENKLIINTLTLFFPIVKLEIFLLSLIEFFSCFKCDEKNKIRLSHLRHNRKK